MSVFKKLMQARVKLQNMKLEKTGHNKFAGYYYFELGDFLPQTQEIFADLGLCGIVSFTADIATLTIREFASTNADIGNRNADEIVITSPMGSAALKGCHEVQNIGAVETYQRRYLWVSAMEIVEHDALDATAGKDVKKPNTPTQQMTDEFDALDKDQQKVFMSVVDTVRVQLDQGNISAGYDLYAEFRDTLEDVAHQAALRSLFSSAERTALQKENQSRKAAK